VAALEVVGGLDAFADVAVGIDGTGEGFVGGECLVIGGGGDDCLRGDGVSPCVGQHYGIGRVGVVGAGDGEEALVGVELVAFEEKVGVGGFGEGHAGALDRDGGEVLLFASADNLLQTVEDKGIVVLELFVLFVGEKQVPEFDRGIGPDGLGLVGRETRQEIGHHETASVGERLEVVVQGVEPSRRDAESRHEHCAFGLALRPGEERCGGLVVEPDESLVGGDAVVGFHDGDGGALEAVPQGDEATHALAASELGGGLVGGLRLVATAAYDFIAALVEGHA